MISVSDLKKESGWHMWRTEQTMNMKLSLNYNYKCYDAINHYECYDAINSYECYDAINHYECYDAINCYDNYDAMQLWHL